MKALLQMQRPMRIAAIRNFYTYKKLEIICYPKVRACNLISNPNRFPSIEAS